MDNTFKQQLDNLPQEILVQPRFFALLGNDKGATPKGWSNPDNQKIYTDIQANCLAGFDTCGHGKADDYFVADFDHALDDSGNFVNADAEQWFNFLSGYGTYCEKSISGHGLHFLFRPSPNKFRSLSGGKRGTLHFGNNAKLEIFYLSKARYCLLTGNVYNCESQTLIISGELADDALQTLLDEIERRNPAKQPARNSNAVPSLAPDSAGYDLWRAEKMLGCINPAELTDSDWLAVISACKNIGVPYAVVDAFNRHDTKRYNAEENFVRWNSAIDPSFNIETLHGIAKRFGYTEKDAQKEWYQLHPELNKRTAPAPMNDDGKVRTRDRIKNAPVDLILPDNYLFGANGITQVVPPKKDNDEPKYISVTKTPILPTKIFFEPNKGTDEYEIAILSRGKWRRVEVEAKVLGDAKALNILCDYGALIIDSARLKNFFASIIALNPDMPEIKAYNQTGWTDDTFQIFAYPHSEGHIIRRTGFDFEKTLATRGDADKFKQKIIEVLDKGGATAHAYIGTALAAVLARPLNILNPQIHLLGTSGSGKTALQKFTAAIFGNPRKLLRTFAATNKNRQLVAAAFNDLPSFFDELETIQGKAAEDNLSNDIYNYSEGKGNQANKRDGTARETFEFGGARLTTGERPLLKQHDLRGAYKRLIQLDTRNRLFDDDFAAELHIFSESNFGHFGKDWITFVTEHMQDISEQFQSLAKGNPATTQYEPTHLKHLAAALVAVEFFKVMLGISTKFNDIAVIRNRRAILDTLPTVADFDDTARAIEYLSGYIAGHEKYFYGKEKNTDEPFTVGFASEYYGLRLEATEYAFFKPALKKILENEGGFASADKLIADFYEKGYLKTNVGRKDHIIKFGQKSCGVYHFKAGILAKDADAAELKYYEELGVL